MLKTDSTAKISLGTPFGAFLENFSKIMDFDHLSQVSARHMDVLPEGQKWKFSSFCSLMGPRATFDAKNDFGIISWPRNRFW